MSDSLLLDISIPVVSTIAGVWSGFKIALSHERKKERAAFEEEKRRVLTALLESLERSSGHIRQMYELHFPAGDYPTYPLDTDALALIVHDTRRLLPEGGRWSERLNGLRFELEHINRKILMRYLAGAPIDGISLSSDWAAYNTTVRTLPSQPHGSLGMSHLILRTKGVLDELIGDLRAYLKHPIG